jgi:glutathione synthase/RimK-type ligase-like ATP-grasp enzyme
MALADSERTLARPTIARERTDGRKWSAMTPARSRLTPSATVALATSSEYPALTLDDQTLVPALAGHGIAAEPAIWNDASVDWRRYGVVVVRSTWDYHHDPGTFRRWIQSLDLAGVPLLNPSPILRWNLDKIYLRELEARGVPIVPTEWVAPRAPHSLREVARRRGWERVVVKPVVAASAHGVWRTGDVPTVADEQRFHASVAQHGVMIQPFVDAVCTEGEWSLMFIEGHYSHAVLKRPRSGDYRVQGQFGGQFAPATPDASLIDAAERVMRALPFPATDCAYARVDGVRDAGVFRLMELELVEPALFLAGAIESSDRLAARIIEGL